jgi:hypothetical protein
MGLSNASLNPYIKRAITTYTREKQEFYVPVYSTRKLYYCEARWLWVIIGFVNTVKYSTYVHG